MTNRMYPNSPYTIDGIPERVSVVSLIIFTTFPDFPAYSVRYTAENTPTGTAITSDSTVMITVFMMAGIIDMFAVLNFHWKSDRCMFGIPLTSMYPTRASRTPTVMTAESCTSIYRIMDPGLLPAFLISQSSFVCMKVLYLLSV